MTRLSRPLLAGSLAAAMALLGGCASTPNSAEAMARQADAQIELARLQDKAARAEYNDQNVYLGLIGKMQQEGMYYASLAHIDAYQQKYGSSTALQVLRADALRETGQDDAALQAYRDLLNTDRAARARHGIGLVLGRQGDFMRAAVELRQAAVLEPVNAQVANDLGYALMRGGALQDARVPVMQALELDANNPRVISNAVVWMLATGKRSEATAMMQRAAMPDPTRAAIRKEADRVTRAAQLRDRTAPRGNAHPNAAANPMPDSNANPAAAQSVALNAGARP
ncbi:Flp pilus assembly protein TadD [Cupriavidus sp. U2]|uniref:tetratricopeptide repeat protein n=1 Tax=Cupriavidus sp. U2 TaxID=2920269 RepID=UPI001E2EB60D|nr:pilus assembly protein TadD [Cupriavidus sp. U2]KAI3592178.1 Flp pilus assembly protein TadD [Cupriavidus sp. U2]